MALHGRMRWAAAHRDRSVYGGCAEILHHMLHRLGFTVPFKFDAEYPRNHSREFAVRPLETVAERPLDCKLVAEQ